MSTDDMFLRSTRVLEASTLGVVHDVHALVHRRVRCHSVQFRGVVNEDALIGSAQPRLGTGRPVVTVVLEGRARVTLNGVSQWLGDGEATSIHDKAALLLRQEGEPYRAVSLEWDAGTLGEIPQPHQRVVMNALQRDEMELVWREIRGCVVRAEQSVERMLRVLCSMGYALRESLVTELAEAALPHAQELTQVLDRLFSNLSEQPMTGDLEAALQLSPRQLQRLVVEYHQRYGFNSTTWVDARSRRRLMMAASMLGANRATVRAIAKVVGYRSAESLTRGLAHAGYPTPSEIQSVVSKYRDDPMGLVAWMQLRRDVVEVS